MFIPDPNFFHPGSASKNFKYFNQKIVSKLSEIWSGSFIPDTDPDFMPSGIPDPGVKNGPNTDPQHWFLSRYLVDAGACRFWPEGRGIFLNKERYHSFTIWFFIYLNLTTRFRDVPHSPKTTYIWSLGIILWNRIGNKAKTESGSAAKIKSLLCCGGSQWSHGSSAMEPWRLVLKPVIRWFGIPDQALDPICKNYLVLLHLAS